MSVPPDHYRVLHVQPDAPAAIIHASYRTLVQRALGASGGGDEIAKLDLAYAILGDPQRRAAYDLERMAQTGVHDASDPTGTRGTHNCLFCGAAHGLTRVLERDDECGQCASPLYATERQRFKYCGQRMLDRIPCTHSHRACREDPESRGHFRAGVEFLTLRFRQIRGNFVSAEA